MQKLRQRVAAGLMAGASALAMAGAEAATVETRESARYGTYLVTSEGQALYLFKADRQGQGQQQAASNCHDACATAWPPLIADGAPSVAEGARDGLVSTIERQDGRQEVTYNGWPLYTYVGDRGKGEATGQDVEGFGAEWYLVSTAGKEVHAGAAKDEASGSSASAGGSDLFEQVAFAKPECVRWDAERGRYLVSNINGGMTEADNNGFISLIEPGGAAEQKWIAGGSGGVTLNAPKGMAIASGTLYVADIDHLRMFDAASGEPKGAVAIDGAKFLNDMAVADDGTLYVTDSGTKDVPGAVYRVDADGSYRPIAEGRDLHRPNGIDWDREGRLVVVTFGGDEVMTLTTDGEVVNRRTLDAGQLDGLVVADDGRMFVSSWKGRHIVRLDPDGTSETVLTNARTAAAFDLDSENNRLVVPLVRENKVAVVSLQ